MAGTPMFVVKAYLPVNESFGKYSLSSSQTPAACWYYSQSGPGQIQFLPPFPRPQVSLMRAVDITYKLLPFPLCIWPISCGPLNR